ncbi:S41 family peptidase [Thermoplasma sp.]|uniref:S41 family peptidase n=1 Tax=Thermoplasma sp. TaxID=1973142 RepID=UPI00126B51C4|nr:S41 family peptidase [Thermoplasma sp.]KAA8922935.1 MAG: hypothetical protein F6Q11_01655 [Thermoplasma sp.]
MNVGSQVKFYIKIDEILSNLPETLEIPQIHTIASKIVALVGDGHTFMDPLEHNEGRIWIELEPIEEKLIVVGVYEKKFSNLIGHCLLAIDEVPVEHLLSKMLEIRGANGIYENLIHLADALKDPYTISFLTRDDISNIKKVVLTLQSFENNSIQKIILPFSQEPPGKLIEHGSSLIRSSKTDISYKILEDRVGYLKIDSMTKYRENYESQLKLGASESFLRELLKYQGFETNGKIEKMISKVPSASDRIVELLQIMIDKNIKDLIVDLRKNKGGNSYLAYILAYFLYGDRALEVDTGYDIERHSAWYKDQFNTKGDMESPGGYTFEEMHKWLSGKRGIDRDEWKEIVDLSPTFAEYERFFRFSSEIKVYVLSSARTFSAGFDLLYMLKKCGATIIGIPSSQPANAFTNTIRFSLDISGLKGWVSSKLMLKDPDKNMFYRIEPDISIGIENYMKHEWDTNTILIETLELIRSKRRDSNY